MTITDGNLSLRVYYEDTDAGGIVYHANYLKFAERGRTEALRTLGYDHPTILKEFDIILIVRQISVDYLSPARLDDQLNVRTEVTSHGNSSLTMLQTISRDGRDLAILTVVIVAINPTGRPVRLPPQLRQIFTDITVQK